MRRWEHEGYHEKESPWHPQECRKSFRTLTEWWLILCVHLTWPWNAQIFGQTLSLRVSARVFLEAISIAWVDSGEQIALLLLGIIQSTEARIKLTVSEEGRLALSAWLLSWKSGFLPDFAGPPACRWQILGFSASVMRTPVPYNKPLFTYPHAQFLFLWRTLVLHPDMDE